MMTNPYNIAKPRQIVFFANQKDSHLVLCDVARRRCLREVYGQTATNEGLSAYDAHGMDVMEGRA